MKFIASVNFRFLSRTEPAVLWDCLVLTYLPKLTVMSPYNRGLMFGYGMTLRDYYDHTGRAGKNRF